MKFIYVIMILCINLSNAIKFKKCDDKGSALHCYFFNITTVNSSPLQSVAFCINRESNFSNIIIEIFEAKKNNFNDPETRIAFSPRQFVIPNEEKMITILFNETCNDKSMNNNTITECFNGTDARLKWLRSSLKNLVISFEGAFKGHKNFTRVGKGGTFSNCDNSNETSAPSEIFPKPPHEREVSKKSAIAFRPYYIIIIIGIGIPFLGAMLALVWTLYHRKKENEKVETIEMEVMEGKVPNVDQPKVGEEETDGPCYVNVGAVDELPEEDVEKDEASNEISYIEVDFEQTKNINSQHKKQAENYINGSKPKVANIAKKESFTDTSTSIYASIVPEPEATEHQEVKDEIDIADDAVQYINLDCHGEK